MSDKEEQVRRMMDLPHPAVPGDLVRRATVRGGRMGRRRRLARRLLWTALLAGAMAFLVWLAVADPWAAPPLDITPPPRVF